MNTQEQHTPGPWRYVENRNTPRVESEATGQWVCNFFGAGGLYASYRANADLIVAAPAMLKSLAWALPWLEQFPLPATDQGLRDEFATELLQATIALAQARPGVASQEVGK